MDKVRNQSNLVLLQLKSCKIKVNNLLLQVEMQLNRMLVQPHRKIRLALNLKVQMLQLQQQVRLQKV